MNITETPSRHIEKYLSNDGSTNTWVTKKLERNFRTRSFYNLYFLPNIIRVIMSRQIIWVVHIARVGQMNYVYKIWDNLRRKEAIWETQV
jgi:hypothetical protein